jgi:hypothetical protein
MIKTEFNEPGESWMFIGGRGSGRISPSSETTLNPTSSWYLDGALRVRLLFL